MHLQTFFEPLSTHWQSGVFSMHSSAKQHIQWFTDHYPLILKLQASIFFVIDSTPTVDHNGLIETIISK